MQNDLVRTRVSELLEFGLLVSGRPAWLQPFHYSLDPSERGMSPEAVAEIEKVLSLFVEEKKLASAVGFIAKQGEVVYHRAFGWKDVQNRVPEQWTTTTSSSPRRRRLP